MKRWMAGMLATWPMDAPFETACRGCTYRITAVDDDGLPAEAIMDQVCESSSLWGIITTDSPERWATPGQLKSGLLAMVRDDPGTRGCLLEMVRVASKHPTAGLVHEGPQHAEPWVVRGCRGEALGIGVTEGEALELALDAAEDAALVVDICRYLGGGGVA